MQKTDKTDSSNVENEKGPTEMDTVRLALLQGVLSTQQHEADHSGDDSDCEDSGSGGGDEEEDPDEARPFNEKIDSSEGGKLSGAELDGVAVNRRAKRLAMNRESARNRRKRKKVLVQTLEVQVAELNKSNQQYQLSNDALTIRVRTLENELAIAHNTIRQLSNASKNSSAFGGGILHAQLQQHFGSSVSSHLPMTAAAMAALAAFRNTQHDTLDPSFRAVPAAPNQDLQRSTIVAGGGGGVSGDNLSRLMQAQYEQYGLASGSPGLPFAPPGAAAAGVSGVSSRNDDPPLRHAMDLQALSQANSSASPSRFVTTNPFGPTVDRNQYGLGGMQSDLFQNMVRPDAMVCYHLNFSCILTFCAYVTQAIFVSRNRLGR